jgi:hypothetical protein
LGMGVAEDQRRGEGGVHGLCVREWFGVREKFR